jgi:hypothetical protein
MKSIRRVMLVVELFGVALAGRRMTPGPVYTTTIGPALTTATGLKYTEQKTRQHDIPKGAGFYDVTDGLVDVATGRALFEIGEGMLEELEYAKRCLKLIEERRVWTSASLFPRLG